MGLVAGLSEAWEAARCSITKAQRGRNASTRGQGQPSIMLVSVVVFMPRETQGKQRKLALPHHGPYRVLELNLSFL